MYDHTNKANDIKV